MNAVVPLFSPQENLQFQARVKARLIASANVPLLLSFAALFIMALCATGYLEWEIVYRVFEYLVGDGGYWSPKLMGFTAAIMVVAFHLQAKDAPDGLASRFVKRAVQFLIPIYLVGIGLFIAVMVMGDEIGAMIGNETVITIGELPTAMSGNWIETLLNTFTHPLGVAAVSLAIGGLAIVNIFVAHKLLELISGNVIDARTRLYLAREALADHATIKQARKEYAELQTDIASLDFWDAKAIAISLASDALALIADALMPHKKWLSVHEVDQPNDFGRPPISVDHKHVASMVKKIEAITLSDILDALQPKLK